ncbi:MAG: hypothetical protein KIT22_18165, partial [Verrucomicrobiae bacterium]|nr:hypothetical protein [Verrucomicrobiae bacterium]
FEATVSSFAQPSNPAYVLLGHRASATALSRAASVIEETIGSPSDPPDPGGGSTNVPSHSDIFLVPVNGALTVGQTIHVGTFRESDIRGDGTVWATDNPGFAGNSFQFQDELLFDITGPLRRWSGTNWSKINVGAEQVDYVEPSPFGDPIHSVNVTSATEFAEGYRISRANTRGTIHTHFTFILRTTNGAAPAVGAYSFPLTVRSPQYAAAPPVQLIFNNGLSEAEFALAEETFRAAHAMRLTLNLTTNGALALRLFTIEGRTYQVRSAPTPAGPWTDWGEMFPGTGGRHEVILNGDPPNQFFQILAP